MSDDLTMLGPDGIRRSYDEHYDTMMEVKQDPTGAHQAIQRQHDHIEQLAATNEELEAKLATCTKYRDAYAECDRIGTQAVRDLEAKLAKAVEALEWQADAIHNSITVNMKHNHRILLDGIYHEGPLVDWVHKILTGFEAINRTTIAELSSVSCANSKGETDEL